MESLRLTNLIEDVFTGNNKQFYLSLPVVNLELEEIKIEFGIDIGIGIGIEFSIWIWIYECWHYSLLVH